MKKLIGVKIPEGLQFADLRLGRDPETLAVHFDWGPIRRICEASGIDESLLTHGPEDNVAGIIVGWYGHHRESGGEPDPIAEQLLAEVRAEDAAPQN